MKTILPIPGLPWTAPLPNYLNLRLLIVLISSNQTYQTHLLRKSYDLRPRLVAWCFAELLTQFNFLLKPFFVQIWVITLSVLAIDLLVLCTDSHSRNQSKMATRSYTPLRRSLGQLSARNTRIASRRAGPSFRGYSTGQEPREPKPFTVWRPYLRLAFGVPFIGGIIYSMV